MISLILAILMSAMISVIMRISQGKTSGSSMLAVNYLMCLVVASVMAGPGNLLPQGEGTGFTVAAGLFNGLLYLLGFTVFQISVKRNGVVMSATFMKLGLLVPMAISILFFGELPTGLQVIGFLLAVGAILLINLEKEDSSLSFKSGLILLLLAGGGGDAMSKIFEELGNPAHSDHFLLFTFAGAFILCVAVVIRNREKPCKGDVLYGLLIGVPNYFSARFLLKSLETVDAVIAYPTYSVATIITVSLIGVIFFREKLKKRQIIAIGIILLSLVLLNI